MANDFKIWLEKHDPTNVSVPRTNLQPQADSDQLSVDDYEKIDLLNNDIQKLTRTIKVVSQREMESEHAKQLLFFANSFTRNWNKMIAYTGDRGLGDS